MMKRVLRHKGYTLIELVLAIAVTSIVATCVSTLIGSALSIRSMADAQSAMYLTSLRLHKAITADISVAADVVLYTRIPAVYSALDDNERVMFVKDGIVVVASKKTDEQSLLPIDSGFDSYQDVTVKSITFQLLVVQDHLTADTAADAVKPLYRAVKVTTEVQKGRWTYTHTSTVRFEEMIIDGKQINLGNPIYTTFSRTYISEASSGDEGNTYSYIRYDIN